MIIAYPALLIPKSQIPNPNSEIINPKFVIPHSTFLPPFFAKTPLFPNVTKT
ncbi:hypothetical protein GGR22_003189 [Flavobacterium gossypii]|uniref:Uncharacterized protein n=1 Tax=Flavobacterium gossypii TaxID=1646119 RepID=A0ABR6DTH3_9FLAO|nr:hypothetical protein [Flavobacterium gossypii]